MKPTLQILLWIITLFAILCQVGCSSTEQQVTTYTIDKTSVSEELLYDNDAENKLQKIIVFSDNTVANEDYIVSIKELSSEEYRSVSFKDVIDQLGMPCSYGQYSSCLSYVWKTNEGNCYCLGFHQIPIAKENEDNVLKQFVLTIGPVYVPNVEELRLFFDGLIAETGKISEDEICTFRESLEMNSTTLSAVVNAIGNPSAYGQTFARSHIAYVWKTVEGNSYAIAFSQIPKNNENRNDPMLQFVVVGGPMLLNSQE